MRKVLASVALLCTVCLNVQCQKAEIHNTVRLNSGYEMPIIGIGTTHQKSAYQVILRWHLQCGTIAIPGSTNAAHIAEDYDIFDFELTPDEMQRINGLDQNYRFASY